MPSLSHLLLHTRPAMLRALSRAGQFAHIQPERIEFRLDQLYDPDWRFKRNGFALPVDDAHEAVPGTLMRARKFLSEPLYEAGTINFFGRAEGITCCLCLAIEPRVASYTSNPVPLGFVSHVCPTFLRHEEPRSPMNGQPMYQSGLPLCEVCKRAVSMPFWREFKWKVPEDTAIWDAALAHLLGDARFKKRVRLNAGNATLLRFDPRRIPHRAAA